MGLKQLHIASFSFVCLLLWFSASFAQETPTERHIGAALRMVGHQVLLSSGDSTSRVLPIVRERDRYRIPLEAEFAFEPGSLMGTVDRVMKESNMPRDYIVQVEDCETGEVVYSYETYEEEQWNIEPCMGRLQPTSCYHLLITLKGPIVPTVAVLPVISSIPATVSPSDDPPTKTSQGTYLPIAILLVVVLGVFLFLGTNKENSTSDPNLIPLGKFQFDKRNSVLSIEAQQIELTGKEADLLLLLLSSANATIEREAILQKVWGDEGHYVGRTLDVFISKLRKKLEADPSVKIVNIRGVGYKLVVDVP